MRTKERRKLIPIEPFNYSFKITLTDDLKGSYYKELPNSNLPDGVPAGIHGFDGKCTSYIFLKHKPHIEEVVHECWHGVKSMLDSRGASLDDETVAYHLGWLVQKVYDFIGRKNVR